MYVYDKNNFSEVTVAKKYKGREDLCVTFDQVLNEDVVAWISFIIHAVQFHIRSVNASESSKKKKKKLCKSFSVLEL